MYKMNNGKFWTAEIKRLKDNKMEKQIRAIKIKTNKYKEIQEKLEIWKEYKNMPS